MSIIVPEAVRQKALALGSEGAAWLSGLDGLVRDIAEMWDIRVGSTLTGGTHALVARAEREDGSEAILKLSLPEGTGSIELPHEIAALRIAEGRGYAELYCYDLERRAMLMEPLGAPLKSLNLTPREQMKIICAALGRSWTNPPPDTEAGLCPFDSIIEWFINFFDDMNSELPEILSRKLYGAAADALERRVAAHAPADCVLVHGDAHNSNLLMGLNESKPEFKFVDPDGICAERAYDLGVVMREWPDELLADPLTLGRERAAYLSRLTGAPEPAIWDWGLIQSISTGLLCLKFGWRDTGEKLLALAGPWAQRRPV